MKRFLSVVAAVTGVLLVTGVAFAHMGMGMGMGHMHGGAGGGPGWMHGGAGGGPGLMGPGAGGFACPGYQAAATQGQTPGAVTEDEAKALVDEYVKAYLPGFTVEKVVPFQGRRMVAYQAELKGPKGETRLLHVNPWGQVMPFGGPPRG